MILSSLYIGPTHEMGRGVFTNQDISRETVVEMSPVIVMSAAERQLLDKTLLHDYIFEWGIQNRQCCMALGYIALYNHSYQSNCEYEMDFESEVMTVKAVRNIGKGEELFINYNGIWNDGKKVWFDAK